jgi:hypothetical protein
VGETSIPGTSGADGDAERVAHAAAANFFRRETLGWTLAYEGKTAQLKHRKGLSYIAALLREPQRKVHVCDLACALPDQSPTAKREPVSPRDRDVERTRKAVRNAIRNAVTCIECAHPELGRHLHNCVITGCFCCYRPERDIVWRIEA